MMWKKRFFTITFWSLAEPNYHQLCSCLKSHCKTSKPPKVPSRGHSSEQKKWRVTGDERSSCHLWLKVTQGSGRSSKKVATSASRTLDSCFFLCTSLMKSGFFRRTCQVKYQYALRDSFASKVPGGACVSDEAQKMDCLKLLQLLICCRKHIVYSEVQRVSPQRREKCFRSRTARRTRRSTWGKANL